MSERFDQPENGFLLHVFQRNRGDRTIVLAVGRLESGETFALADHQQRPSFYVRDSDAEVVGQAAGAGNDLALEPTDWTTMDGETVVRVAANRVQRLRALADKLSEREIRTYEADVVFARQYLMDRGIRGSVRISGSWRPGTGVDRVYTDPIMEPGDWQPALSVLVLDIETLPDASQVLAISFVGMAVPSPSGSGVSTAGIVRDDGDQNDVSVNRIADIAEIHIVGEPALGDPPELQCHADERQLLEAAAARIRDVDPDILSGWNLVDFDLPVLQRRCRELGLPFNLGRSNDASWYREGEVWGASRMVVYGRQVLDALHLIRTTPQRFDDYRLGTVARSIVGRGKTVEANSDESMPERIMEAFREDRSGFCEYCLEDSRLVRDILRHEGLIELSLRRSLLTGLPLERAWGSVAAFDFLYIGELHRRGMVAPTNDVDRVRLGGAPGGLVMASKVGLYHHVFVFDFKSLYPSIIRTFNIDPLSHIRARVAGTNDAIIAPNGATFDRNKGILPGLLERFFSSRDQAKSEGDQLASYAYKIVMNSFYGVLATGSCRFAEEQLAGAITGFGHYVLKWVRQRLEEAKGADVLYGDTDSLFIDMHLPDDIAVENALAQGDQLCRWMNGELTAHVRDCFGLPSNLELEFEKYYTRFFLPPTRGNEDRGRAKGYAGLLCDSPTSSRLEIIGMEAVRRDWTDLAHQLQRDLLEKLFRDAPATEIETRVLRWIDSVRGGEHDGELVYRKSLRKPLSSYTKSNPPHVVAARQLPNPSGTIHYLMTVAGPQPVGHVNARLDYEHYVEKQIAPIVRTIGQVCDIDVESAVTGVSDLFRGMGH
jgi:DNA polymerase-2